MLSESAYVVFGGGVGPVDLTTLGDRGFRIDGADKYTRSGTAVAAAGDVNLDGHDDVLIDSPGSVDNRLGSGSAYVVFGVMTPARLIWRISGIAGSGSMMPPNRIASAVSWPVGWGRQRRRLRRRAPRSRTTLSEPAYVVFGGSHTTTVDLNALGAGGFRVSGNMLSMDGAGDVNADGYDDLIFGDPIARPASSNYGWYSGSAYVVFGGPTTDVDLADLGDRGLRIDGAAAQDRVGSSVAGAGDVNGDRVDDLLIGEPGYPPSPSWAGPPPTSYVIFGGNTDALDLTKLGGRCVKIAGSPVAAPGDVDGDGVNDVLIRTVGAGDDRLVFGAVSDLGDRKVRLDGTGWAAAGGDVNGDGGDDLLIPLGGWRTKRVYVAFGGPPRLVMARKKAKKIRRAGRTKLVREICVGDDQSARTTVTVLPKKARKTVKVKTTNRRVVVRTKKTPNKSGRTPRSGCGSSRAAPATSPRPGCAPGGCGRRNHVESTTTLNHPLAGPRIGSRAGHRTARRATSTRRLRRLARFRRGADRRCHPRRDQRVPSGWGR